MPKKILTILLVSVIMLPSFYGCKKHTNKPAVDQLPAATQYGANTFGCLVNGKVFVPKGKFGSLSPILTCYYQYIYPESLSGYVFEVAANRKGDDCELTAISINSDSVMFRENETLLIGQASKGKVGARYSYYPDCITLDNDYKTTDSDPSELTITKFDEINQIISGTFQFTAVNADGDTVKVTDGRFDMKFTR